MRTTDSSTPTSFLSVSRSLRAHSSTHQSAPNHAKPHQCAPLKRNAQNEPTAPRKTTRCLPCETKPPANTTVFPATTDYNLLQLFNSHFCSATRRTHRPFATALRHV